MDKKQSDDRRESSERMRSANEEFQKLRKETEILYQNWKYRWGPMHCHRSVDDLNDQQRMTYYKSEILTNHIKSRTPLIFSDDYSECPKIKKAFMYLKNKGLIAGTYEFVSTKKVPQPGHDMYCFIRIASPDKDFSKTYEKL